MVKTRRRNCAIELNFLHFTGCLSLVMSAAKVFSNKNLNLLTKSFALKIVIKHYMSCTF